MERKPIPILIAEDDPDDREMAKEALVENYSLNDLHFVTDGEELLNYLRHEGKYKNLETSPRPGLILLDLNMPKKDGRETLKEIKNDPDLKHIPVVVLTTSKTDEDVFRSYDLGVNCFITKPVNFQELIDVIRFVGQYWLEIVELPKFEGQK